MFEALDHPSSPDVERVMASFMRLTPACRDAVMLLMQAMIDGHALQLIEATARRAANASPEVIMAIGEIRKILSEPEQ